MQAEKQRLETAIAEAQRRLATVRQQLQWYEDNERATERVLALEDEKNNANKAYVSLRADELRIERYDLLIGVQPLHTKIKQMEGDIAALKQCEAALGNEERLCAAALEECSNTLTAARETVNECQKQLQRRRPHFNHAYQLMGEAKTAELQRKDLQNQLSTLEVTLNENKLLVQQSKAHLEEAQRKLEAATFHRSALAVHSRMFENCELVLEKLRRLFSETNMIDEIDRDEREANLRVGKLQAELNAAQREERELEDELAALRSELGRQLQAIKGVDGEALINANIEKNARMHKLRAARILWRHIADGYAEMEERDVSIRQQEIRACHFPAAYAEMERLGIFSEQKSQLDQHRRRLKDDVAAWTEYAALDDNFAECSPNVNREARSMMIEMLLNNAEKSVGETAEELAAFKRHQNEINTLNAKIDAVVKREHELHKVIGEKSSKLQHLMARLEEMQRTKQKSQRAGEVYYADLDAVVSISGWYATHLADPELLVRRINELYNDWRQTTAAIDENTHLVALFKEELRGNEEKLQQTMVYATALQESLAEWGKRATEFTTELAHIMSEGNIETEEKLLAEALREARGVKKVRSEEYRAALMRHAEVCGKKKEICRLREEKHEDLSRHKSDLDRWIVRFNGEYSPVQYAELERVFAETADWSALRATIYQRREALALANDHLEAAREELKRIRLIAIRPSGKDDETLPALTEQLGTLTEKIAKMQERLGIIRFQLVSESGNVDEEQQ